LGERRGSKKDLKILETKFGASLQKKLAARKGNRRKLRGKEKVFFFGGAASKKTGDQVRKPWIKRLISDSTGPIKACKGGVWVGHIARQICNEDHRRHTITAAERTGDSANI